MPIKLHVQLVAQKSKTERCLIIQGIHGLVEPFNDGDPAAPWLLLEFRMRAFIGTKYVRSAFQLVPTASMSSPKDGRHSHRYEFHRLRRILFLPAIVRAANASFASSTFANSAATAAVHPTRADRPRASARALTPLTIARGMRRRRLRGDVMGVSPSQAGSPHPRASSAPAGHSVPRRRRSRRALPRRPDRRSMRATRKPLRQPLPTRRAATRSRCATEAGSRASLRHPRRPA